MARQNDSAARTQNPKLRERLQTLIPRILKDRDRRIGEQNTKATLVEPILEVLGWDIRDWDEVHREYRGKSADSPVDYALKIMRTPRLFLEAKGLGEDLADRKWVAQVLGYATVAGVEWCVLTDGDEWRFYNSTAAVDADEKLFRRVRLSDGNLDDTMATLLLLARDNIEGNLLEPLWAAHFVDRRVKQALLDMLESRDKGLVRLIHQKVPKVQPKQITESLGRLEVRLDSPPVRPLSGAMPSVPALQPAGSAPKTSIGRKPKQDRLADLIAAGVLKAPMRLFSRYKKQMLEATLLPTGEVEFQGQRYASPSDAGGAAKATLTGKKMATDGWSFWRIEGGDGKPRTLASIREAYQKC